MLKARWVMSVALVGTLIGCAAIQQQQAAADAKACFATLEQSPEVMILLRRVPKDAADATLQQLSDPSFISQDEAAALTAYHPRAKFCQTQFVERLQTSAPTLAPIFAQSYRDQDNLLLSLIGHQMSWGEFNRRSRDLKLLYQSRFVEEQQRLTAEASARNAGLIQALATAAAISQQSSQPSSLPPGASRYPSSGSSISCIQQGAFTNCEQW